MTSGYRAPSVAVWAIAGCMAWGAANAAELPKATQKILADNKVDPVFLKDIDAELNVPADWIERAKKEGKVTITGAWDDPQFVGFIGPFKERYPFIAPTYLRASYENRVLKPLMSFKQGRYIVDVLTGLTGAIDLLEEVNALDTLAELPSYKKIDPKMRDPKHKWVGHELRYWCTAYNTTTIKKESLPKTWDDLISDKSLQNGKVSINDRAMTWVMPLWNDWGSQKGNAYLTTLFETVKPVLRKEGINALTGLTALGEAPFSIPASDYRVYQLAEKGGTVGWHCPEPVPVSYTEIAMFRGGPGNAAAKLFINWLLSSEGQVAQYYNSFSPPVHPGLSIDRFSVYPAEVKGKRQVLINNANSEKHFNEAQGIWEPLWQKRMQ